MRIAATIATFATIAAIASGDAVAQPAETIALATTDRALRAAVHDALAPAGMNIVATDDTAPSTIADIAEASRALADREHARAAVWIASAPTGSTLVVYDRGVDRSLVRTLPYAPPFSASQATEAARTVRTMLRALRASDETQPPPVIRDPDPAIGVIGPPPPPHHPLLAFELAAGVRILGPAATAAPSGSLAAILRPDELGLALTARFAPTADVTTDVFTGRISDNSLGLAVRQPVVLAPGVSGAASLGVSAHLVSLHTAEDAELRIDPAIYATIAATYRIVPTVAIGFAMSADVLLRRQEYASGMDTLLVVPRVQFTGGVVLVARVL